MNALEVVGLAFLAIVVVNLVSMVWAIKKARLMETVTNEQEV